jgi:ssDNA-binding Zn-finger/Zn-ribbon topoisomerase 1
MEQPERQGDTDVWSCPICGSPTVGRKSRKTGRLYFGCQNFATCKFNGRRDFDTRQLEMLDAALVLISDAIRKRGLFAVAAP